MVIAWLPVSTFEEYGVLTGSTKQVGGNPPVQCFDIHGDPSRDMAAPSGMLSTSRSPIPAGVPTDALSSEHPVYASWV